MNKNSEGVQERKKSHTSANRKHKKWSIFNCTECEELVCQHCSLNDHEDHNCELMEKTSPDAKAKLLTDMQSLKVLLEELAKAREKIHATIFEVENRKLASINNIHTKFKELHNILEQRKQELVEDATTIAQLKLHNLTQQEKTLSLAKAELQGIVDYTEQFESLSTFTNINIKIENILQKKIQEHHKLKNNLEPVEEADMAVEVTCAEALEELCLTKANITTAVDPTKCTFNLTAPAEVGKPYVGILTTRLSNGKPNTRKFEITCHLKALHNGVTINCANGNNGPGRYSIQLPTAHGRHELTVLINGHHVAGSPFPVYVSNHPTQLDKPVKVLVGLTRPLGITSNSKGEIFVIAVLSIRGTTDIVKYRTKERRAELIEISGLVIPCCIACDDEDNVYCIDRGSNKILTCESNGNNIQIYEVELEKNSSGRTTLAINDKKIFIAEFGLRGIIKVYNKQLQYLATIIKHRNMNVVDISFDIHQNVYASDFNNSCVHVFTNNGSYLHSIGHDKKELMEPWGLCVHGQYVYVTDVNSHCVFVFTTDGKYVSSFGQQGHKEGDFILPYYIHVDINGSVYVTDMKNTRIQCF